MDNKEEKQKIADEIFALVDELNITHYGGAYNQNKMNKGISPLAELKSLKASLEMIKEGRKNIKEL